MADVVINFEGVDSTQSEFNVLRRRLKELGLDTARFTRTRQQQEAAHQRFQVAQLNRIRRERKQAEREQIRSAKQVEREQIASQRNAFNHRLALIKARRKAEQQAERARERALTRFNNQLSRISGRLALGGGFLAFNIGRGILDASIQFDTARNALVALTGSIDEANRRLERYQQLAKLPALSLQSITQAAVQFEAVGLQAQLSERAIEQLGNQLALFGETDLSPFVRAISQISQSTEILQEEINQIRDAGQAGAGIIALIREEFGTIRAEGLREQGITPDEFIRRLVDALERAPRATGGAANAFQNFRIAVNNLGRALGDLALPQITIRLEEFTKRIDQLSEQDLSGLKEQFDSITNSLFDVANTFTNLNILDTFNRLKIAIAGFTTERLGSILGSISKGIVETRQAAQGTSIVLEEIDGRFVGIARTSTEIPKIARVFSTLAGILRVVGFAAQGISIGLFVKDLATASDVAKGVTTDLGNLDKVIKDIQESSKNTDFIDRIKEIGLARQNARLNELNKELENIRNSIEAFGNIGRPTLGFLAFGENFSESSLARLTQLRSELESIENRSLQEHARLSLINDIISFRKREEIVLKRIAQIQNDISNSDKEKVTDLRQQLEIITQYRDEQGFILRDAGIIPVSPDIHTVLTAEEARVQTALEQLREANIELSRLNNLIFSQQRDRQTQEAPEQTQEQINALAGFRRDAFRALREQRDRDRERRQGALNQQIARTISARKLEQEQLENIARDLAQAETFYNRQANDIKAEQNRRFREQERREEVRHQFEINSQRLNAIAERVFDRRERLTPRPADISPPDVIERPLEVPSQGFLSGLRGPTGTPQAVASELFEVAGVSLEALSDQYIQAERQQRESLQRMEQNARQHLQDQAQLFRSLTTNFIDATFALITGTNLTFGEVVREFLSSSARIIAQYVLEVEIRKRLSDELRNRELANIATVETARNAASLNAISSAAIGLGPLAFVPAIFGSEFSNLFSGIRELFHNPAADQYALQSGYSAAASLDPGSATGRRNSDDFTDFFSRGFRRQLEEANLNTGTTEQVINVNLNLSDQSLEKIAVRTARLVEKGIIRRQ